MYPSGVWRGFWQQEGFGRQTMREFELRFKGERIVGSGTDIVGPFTVRGECNPSNGHVVMVKQYHNKHAVTYDGGPDGEGSIQGTWQIDGSLFGVTWKGPFLMQPVVAPTPGDDGIREIGK